MSRAVLLAGGAGVLGVLGAWELIVVASSGGVARAIERVVAPLRRAGALGEAPSAAERRRLAALAAAVLLGSGWLLGGPLAALALAAGAPAVVGAAVRARRRHWRIRLAAGAPAVARALADALAGGHSIRGAVTEAASGGGLTGPAGRELRAAAHALALGETTDVVLERLRRRASAPAYDTLVAAVLLQRDAGGDLAGLLRELAVSLESGVRQARDARATTAQARFTGMLVAAMPAGAAALGELAQPGSLRGLLASPLTATLLVAAAILQVTGLVAIRWLSRTDR
jgi:tight adherence protein B